jgi:hypothetical protein
MPTALVSFDLHAISRQPNTKWHDFISMGAMPLWERPVRKCFELIVGTVYDFSVLCLWKLIAWLTLPNATIVV